MHLGEARIAGAEPDDVTIRRRKVLDDVVAFTFHHDEGVGAQAADQDILAKAAIDLLRARSTPHDIIGAIACRIEAVPGDCDVLHIGVIAKINTLPSDDFVDASPSLLDDPVVGSLEVIGVVATTAEHQVALATPERFGQAGPGQGVGARRAIEITNRRGGVDGKRSVVLQQRHKRIPDGAAPPRPGLSTRQNSEAAVTFRRGSHSQWPSCEQPWTLNVAGRLSSDRGNIKY